MSAYAKMIEALKAAEDDVIKGYGGNKAAATRARSALLEMSKTEVRAVRDDLLSIKKGDLDTSDLVSAFPLPESGASSDSEDDGGDSAS